ncbi:hypothetical protein C0995_005933 [Termitomyces sp. Mi166|nr:hypothetical protein C0995_005933 [Termitomyces sp. Mi166\
MEKLETLPDKGAPPEWSNARYSYLNGKLIVNLPLYIHEIWPDVIARERLNASDILLRGDSAKVPDYSIFEKSKDLVGRTDAQKLVQQYPTVVFEAAYSEGIWTAREAAVRTLTDSVGAVLLVIIIDLPYQKPMDGGRRQRITTEIHKIDIGLQGGGFQAGRLPFRARHLYCKARTYMDPTQIVYSMPYDIIIQALKERDDEQAISDHMKKKKQRSSQEESQIEHQLFAESISDNYVAASNTLSLVVAQGRKSLSI